ncbi:MAG: hypothetical protein HZY79_09170 [Rhodoblastus sp.]|nr:MAG: hypothetical protein HZY79_09170 [Rhodoblastus sp.]
MSYRDDQFGFARANVSRVARRQLSLSAALIALVGFATLGAALSVGGASGPSASAARIDRAAPGAAFGEIERTVSPVSPG